MSIGSGLFTADSKINEYPKVNSYYEKQQQYRDMVYNGAGHKFGCYGPIFEDLAGESGMHELDPEIFGQQALRYNKNDPFGVNMRLK